jgi:hypothetical protein
LSQACELLKTTYQNPTRQWLLQGTYIKTTLGDITFSPTTSAFSDTHDPEIHDDGTICFFDNGGYASGATGGSTSQFHSRAVEYQIDESKKTATLIWEFPGNATVPDALYTANWYTPFWGSVHRLATGHRSARHSRVPSTASSGSPRTTAGGVGVPFPDRLRRLPGRTHAPRWCAIQHPISSRAAPRNRLPAREPKVGRGRRDHSA